MKWDLWQPTSLRLESEPKKHSCFFYFSHSSQFSLHPKTIIFWLPNTDRALFRLYAFSVGSKSGLCVLASEVGRRFCCERMAVGHRLIQVFIRKLAPDTWIFSVRKSAHGEADLCL